MSVKVEKTENKNEVKLEITVEAAKFEDAMIEEIVALVRKYDAVKHVYFMTANDECIKDIKKIAPDIKCCLGWSGKETGAEHVDRAIACGADKIQFFKPHYDQESIDRAHANGIICNIFNIGLQIHIGLNDRNTI